jgi:Ca-activated chloride channel family protein
MVLVPVTVTDHHGKTVEGLKAHNFTILDEKTPQQIVSFSAKDAACSVGLVLDTSGSMRDMLGTAKEVVHAFLTTANSADEFLLLTVSTQPEAVSGFTTDTAELENRVQFTRPGGLTALLDTVYLGLSHMRHASHSRRALLVLSDGMDNHSRYSKSELMRVALETDVQVYSIIFDSNASSLTVPYRPGMIAKPGDRRQQPEGGDLLGALATKTGGLHFRVHRSELLITGTPKRQTENSATFPA